MKSATTLLRSPWFVAVYCLVGATACVGSSFVSEEETNIEPEKPEVLIDATALGSTVAPYAFGMHTSVYDNALNRADSSTRLPEAGIKLLRYPGGGYSDNYHWSTHHMTPFSDGKTGYLAAKSDFGNYVAVLERSGTTAMITVNYGSNSDNTGPGEPNEAAAWVAYANGQPDSATVIGLDSTGRDWKTVGYWASMRSAAPLGVDDGYNFLRIQHPAPLAIKYWEVGNEVFGNGYYESDPAKFGYEFDLHLPYTAANTGKRFGNEALSPTTYGRGWLEFASAMRAVDPSIRVGAVLVTPPKDYSWGPNWNNDVLAACGKSVDFAIVHYYPTGTAESVLDAPRLDVPQIFSELRQGFAEHAGENAASMEVAVTELGPNVSGIDPFSTGIFAAEAYVTFLQYGAVNLDWLELHNGTFLNERNTNVGPAFQGIKLAHHFVQPGDTFVKAKATILGLVAHAALRPDQSVSLMLANIGTKARTGVPVTITGPALASEGTRIDYQRLAEGNTVDGALTESAPIAGVGNAFTVDLPPRFVTVINIPLAPAE